MTCHNAKRRVYDLTLNTRPNGLLKAPLFRPCSAREGRGGVSGGNKVLRIWDVRSQLLNV